MSAATPRRSIAIGLAAMLAVVTLVVFSAVAALLHWSLARELRFSERLQLEGKAAAVQQIVDRAGPTAGLAGLTRELDDLQTNDGDVRLWIVDGHGAVLYGAGAAPLAPAGGDELVAGEREDGDAIATLQRPLRGTGVLAGARVLVVLHPRARQALMATFDRATLVICAAGVAVTILLSVWVARRGLRPLHRLSAEAAAVSPNALAQRLTTPRGGRELAPLVDSFNQSLNRVEEAYRQLEGFSADVAHELRTPLAVMITGFEVSLARPRTADEARDIIASGLEEVRGLSAIVDDMLFLARADRGEMAADLASIDVRDQVLDVLEYLDASIEQGRHQVRVDGAARLLANAALLRRALFNLMTNAFRHTAPGETIVVQVAALTNGARIEVRNPGEPLGTDVCERMFDRFWRRDSSRSKRTEGHGLGLGIVRGVARMHGGDTFANSKDGVTTVGFTLAAPPPA
jgi:two-component system heavy metal sensor histidine kinase CusS